MKILKKGNPWFVGRKLTCNECGCKVQLELGDKPQVWFPIQEIVKPPKKSSLCYDVWCPNCGKSIKMDK